MIVVSSTSELPLPGRPRLVATLGAFDGLHRGHQAILERVRSRARERGALAAVITFDPHPLRVLAPDRAPRLLLTRTQKLALLETLGLDAAVVLPFDRILAAMPAELFARDLLARKLLVSELFVGPDFRFGRGRAGDAALLNSLGRELDLTACAVQAVLQDGERISASRIRRELAEGRVGEAAALLGRPFCLAGTIVHGEGRGRQVVVPTANLAPENEFLPARGVYITQLRWGGGRSHCGLTNIGTRPTFGGQHLTVETFLPGFTEELYGTRAELDLFERVRPEKLFETPQDLRAQIERDLQFFQDWKQRRRS